MHRGRIVAELDVEHAVSRMRNFDFGAREIEWHLGRIGEVRGRGKRRGEKEIGAGNQAGAAKGA